jgi:hypothetical protein
MDVWEYVLGGLGLGLLVSLYLIYKKENEESIETVA